MTLLTSHQQKSIVLLSIDVTYIRVWWHESVVYLTIQLALLMSCLWLRCLYVRITSALTLWRPLLPYGLGTTIKHPVRDRVKTSFVIFDIRALWRSALLCYSSVSVSACDWLTSHRTRDITSTATVCSLYVGLEISLALLQSVACMSD